jgi:hypothetical protein
VVKNLKVESLEIDKATILPNQEWFTFASFYISEVKKKWGLINAKITYKLDGLLLLITSKDVKEEEIEDVVSGAFAKRLVLEELDPEQIKKYVADKVEEAEGKADSEEVFKHLEKYFVVEE